MALGTIATIATIASAATSIAGGAYAATRKQPTQPDAASSSREVALAQAGALPDQLKLQQLMQQGGKGMVNMPAHAKAQKVVEVTTGSKIDKGNTILGQNLAGVDPAGAIYFGLGKRNKDTREVVPYVESEWQPGGKYYDQLENGQVPWYWQNEAVPEGPQEVDFTGFGTADIQGQQARDQADLEIALGKKYGTDFATAAKDLQEQADPLGTKARNLEYELLQKDMPVSPINQTLNDQILAQTKAGRGLDPMTRELLDKSVAEASAARGGGGPTAAQTAESMSTGAEGEARLNAGISKAGKFLSSGQTPEDVAYKRNQQTLQNLGAFNAGQTPQSQFGAIARAGQGATPVTGAQKNAVMPNNAAQIGSNYANQAYAENVQSANNTPTWFSGLSSMLSSIGALKTATG